MTENTKSHLVDLELAIDVMGWTFVQAHIAKKDPPVECEYVCAVGDHELGGPYVYRRRYGAGDFYKWSPTEYDRDALDVAKALQETGHKVTIVLEALPTKAPAKYLCSVGPGPFEGIQAIACGASTLRQAICGAAQEWIHMTQGEDT